MPTVKTIIVVFLMALLLPACATETPTPETITVQEEVPVTVQTMQEVEVTRVVEVEVTRLVEVTREVEAPMPQAAPVVGLAPEYAVNLIAVANPLAQAEAEISGLTWYGDNLIVLPQYPNFASEEGDGALYALAKDDILAYLDGTRVEPLQPQPIPFMALGLQDEVEGFEGYEAITFIEDQVFLTIEAETDEGVTGYLVSGTIAPDLSQVSLDTETLAQIEPQSDVENMAYESLFVADDDTLVTLYEANGAVVNESPMAYLINPTLTTTATIPIANIDYRVTDATALDENNRFWVINYFFPGEEVLQPETEPLAEEYGEGPTHAVYAPVERLVQFEYSEEAITVSGDPPLQLQMLPDAARNWEGIVRLDDQGFLLATDRFPQTLLAFVALPEEAEE